MIKIAAFNFLAKMLPTLISPTENKANKPQNISAESARAQLAGVEQIQKRSGSLHFADKIGSESSAPDVAIKNEASAGPEDFIKSIKSNYGLGTPKVAHDLGETDYNQKKWYDVSFNKKTKEFDVKLNYVVSYSKFFKVPYDNHGSKTTLEGENPGLLKQVQAHERGHVDQKFEQASQAKLSVTFEFGGIKKTYQGHADDILTNIYKDYKAKGKVSGIDDFQKNILPWAESAVMGELAKALGKPYPHAEDDANLRAEQANGKPQYGVDAQNNSNIKFKGEALN